ncbi:SGNH/GDSL hydrolase family protein [Actinacidiphila glaucinigra]|uniref:SGNH/GDSL hydrolase family protein n=1 Tax=Actinacidiphila glaucinigra TaxID=235986 RepID=UPI0037C72864
MSAAVTPAKEGADRHCLPADEAAELLRPAPWQRFAVMGDSFAEGVGGPCPGYADVPWPERVAGALRATRPGLEYLNTGETGLRTAQVRRTQLERVLAFRPDLVNVASGGNDLFVPEPDLDAVEADLDAVYRALREQKAHIFAFTVADIFDAFPELVEFRARITALNERIRAVAGRYDATVVEMERHPVRNEPTLMSGDGIHFSMHGHAVLASEIIRNLAQDIA